MRCALSVVVVLPPERDFISGEDQGEARDGATG
jgi:hypothetical protein